MSVRFREFKEVHSTSLEASKRVAEAISELGWVRYTTAIADVISALEEVAKSEDFVFRFTISSDEDDFMDETVTAKDGVINWDIP